MKKRKDYNPEVCTKQMLEWAKKMSESHHGDFPINYYTCEAWIDITESVNE